MHFTEEHQETLERLLGIKKSVSLLSITIYLAFLRLLDQNVQHLTPPILCLKESRLILLDTAKELENDPFSVASASYDSSLYCIL